MTLAFSETLKGKPTYFPELIHRGLMQFPEMGTAALDPEDLQYYQEAYRLKFGRAFPAPTLDLPFNQPDERKPKYHTIRRDENLRWQPGNKIHFVINNRHKDRFQFAPTLKCTEVEPMRITWEKDLDITHAYPKPAHRVWITFYKMLHKGGNIHFNDPRKGLKFGPYYVVKDEANGWKMLGGHQMLTALAVNDGFNSALDFLQYFDEDFTGHIIHWTDTVRYFTES